MVHGRFVFARREAQPCAIVLSILLVISALLLGVSFIPRLATSRRRRVGLWIFSSCSFFIFFIGCAFLAVICWRGAGRLAEEKGTHMSGPKPERNDSDVEKLKGPGETANRARINSSMYGQTRLPKTD